MQIIAHTLPSRITSRFGQTLSSSQPPEEAKSVSGPQCSYDKRQKQMLTREYHFRILWIERTFSQLGKILLCGGGWRCEMSSALEPAAPAVTRRNIPGTSVNSLTPGVGSLGTEIGKSAACRGVACSWPLKREEQENSEAAKRTNSQNTCEIPHRDSKNSSQGNRRVLRIGEGRERNTAMSLLFGSTHGIMCFFSFFVFFYETHECIS